VRRVLVDCHGADSLKKAIAVWWCSAPAQKEYRMSAAVPVVLIVDDDQDSREMYTLALSAMGFRPLAAVDADDAVARARECPPDVVVTDVHLPGVSGLELTRQLRTDVRTKSAGIILLTGHAVGSVRQQAHDAGCDRFLVKPYLPDALAVQIHEVLHARRLTS
jgi:CheY-like chemotaxis protein